MPKVPQGKPSGKADSRKRSFLLSDFSGPFHSAGLTGWGLGAILLAFLGIGALYAIYTPAWQVPDEPAHYNYIRALAEETAIPVLETGDYDQAYLEELKSRKFPPDRSITDLEYEDHQPPLYYLLMAPPYVVFDGSLLALRLVSLVYGAGIVICAFAVARQVWPNEPALALAAAGFVAFVPQYVAQSAGVTNDTLAGLIAALTLTLLVLYIRPREPAPKGYVRESYGGQIGVLIGLAFLTKTTVYFLPLLAALAWGWRWRQERWPARLALREAALIFVPALLLGLLWWGRNLAVYGWPDLLGLRRHEAVVLGQPRTSEWIAQYGLVELVRRFLVTSFNSWWGQFGWMGVPMDPGVYKALLGLTLAVTAAHVWRLIAGRAGRSSSFQMAAQGLLGLAFVSSATLYAGYNVTFVQHQGRYLFSALIPVGLAAAAGLKAWGVFARRLIKLPVALVPLAAVILLAVLDVFALFRFIVPALATQ